MRPHPYSHQYQETLHTDLSMPDVGLSTRKSVSYSPLASSPPDLDHTSPSEDFRSMILRGKGAAYARAVPDVGAACARAVHLGFGFQYLGLRYGFGPNWWSTPSGSFSFTHCRRHTHTHTNTHGNTGRERRGYRHTTHGERGGGRGVGEGEGGEGGEGDGEHQTEVSWKKGWAVRVR
eukprot:3401395-Rhodomonas_salina.1